MPPNPRVGKAFCAMRDLGIKEEKVKPVLKRLLKVYDKNWELIEEENYRALVDAIFEEETEATKKKRNKNSEANLEETQLKEEPERPLKRLRLRHKDSQPSPSFCNSEGHAHVLPASQALIKPKDEPFTEDLLRLDVPLAVIHPDSLPEGDASIGHGSLRGQDVPKILASQHVTGEYRSETISPSSRETKTNCNLPNIAVESTSSLDIVSSGGVKISFNFDPAVGRPNFCMPNRDAVLKMVEDKCLRSYKLLDPNFSLMKLMKDMCDCVLELGTTTANESQETIDVTSAVGLMKKVFSTDGLGALNPLNGLGNSLRDDELVRPQTPRLIPSCNESDVKNNSIGDSSEDNDGENSRSLVVQQNELTLANIRSLHDVSDIAKGQEAILISLVNEVNKEWPPYFSYIPQNVIFQNAKVNFALALVGDDKCCLTCVGNCLLSPSPCACAHEAGGQFAYMIGDVVKEDFLEDCISMHRDPPKHHIHYCKECPVEKLRTKEILEPCKGHLARRFIKECWYKCGCNKHCGNRVVQRGIKCKLQVFMTGEGKGWGLRTLEDLPKGAFVCEYVGEVLTNMELYERVSRSPRLGKHSYPVLLDADWASGVLKDEETLCLDATFYGNVARFINHRCGDSNLVEIPVEVETPDHHYYHLALFTTRKVFAMEELTWDYGIDFDDEGHPFKAFRCCCGSSLCRNIRRLCRSRTRSAAALVGEDV